MADYMAGKKPQGRIQEASQSVGSIATINKEPLIGLMKGSESGGYLLSHNAVQYHRVPSAMLSLCPVPSLCCPRLSPPSLPRPRAAGAHSPHPAWLPQRAHRTP